MTEKQTVVRLNCLLQGEIADKFNVVKLRKGLTNNTEVVRLAINELYSKIKKEA